MPSAGRLLLATALASTPTIVECWVLPSSAASSPALRAAEVTAAAATPAVVGSPRLQAAAAETGAEAAVATPVPQWARALLAALAVVAVVATGGPRAARADSDVNVFFGQGCFWHVQHDIVRKEMKDLKRDGSSVTALAGYAGGKEVGKKGNVCYHNLAFAPDYGSMGHTEVVNVQLPESKVLDFAKDYLDAADGYRLGRADPQDRGTEYRSAIGLPGGMDGPLFKQVETANAGRLQLVRGEGNDADTVGTKKVWVYDSNKFPFYQGEVYHQFHDDMLERYADSYHKMKGTLVSRGALKPVECPEVGF